MATTSLRALLHQLRRIAGVPAGGLADAQLLERFVNDHDGAAFEVLVWRHGPMVLNVCRRLLHQEQDAEDAFQATFLTLVRKAPAISKRHAVASWLYKVAYRIALEAKAAASERKLRESQVTQLPQPSQATPDLAAWHELRAVLDEEVHRLPAKYRLPVILCYFQGKTHEEIARDLGCPKGTVAIRLSRARELLRPRLARRGLTLSGGMLTALLSDYATAAVVSQALVKGTVQSAQLFAAGETVAGVLSARSVALAEGALKSMFMTKLKMAAALVLLIGVTGTGTGILTYRGMAGEQAIPQSANAIPLPAPDLSKPTITVSAGQPNAVVQADGKRSADQAKAELAMAIDLYEEQERQWTKELIRARLELMQREDKLRMVEQEANPANSEIFARLNAARKALAQREKVLPKDNPRLNDMRDELRWLEVEWKAILDKQKLPMTSARQEFVEAEEELRLLERLQATQRERALRKLHEAEEGVRRFHGTSPGVDPMARSSRELEMKMDQLLREMADLRREMRRRATEKAQPKTTGSHPNQP
ncbi:MAG TPA: sigma-70 family RNA polymerase sigma factor [Gemmataceae bacterium]|nr:sigma-70 family RNA polymerase sigma factor [Gemmataceae bacterium]